jgi:hypothetical protein
VWVSAVICSRLFLPHGIDLWLSPDGCSSCAPGAVLNLVFADTATLATFIHTIL